MKRSVAAVFLLIASVAAEEKDGSKLLNDLTAANEAEDTIKIDLLVRDVQIFGDSTEDQALADSIGGELVKSLKVCKGNWGTLKEIIQAMGALRSKKALNTLKRLGFRKEPAWDDEEAVHIAAILALGRYRDTKLLGGLADQCKSKNVMVARAAYEAFKFYGTEPGRVRKKAAEIIMKRMDAEYPSSAPGGAGISAEQQERWNKLRETVVASMQALCHQPTINDIENWREWWREYKKDAKAWRDPKKGKE